ncbi:cystatin-B-like [Ptychodera flava]|uniref:cystatin-B-like n=1 Tax=Ptychodera flava TaxID=63121 RepID=UPI00396AACB0
MAMAGGLKSPEPATEEVQELLNGIKTEVEEKVGSKFDVYAAKLYSTQVVNGVNYFVKVYIGNDKYIHVRFHQALPMAGSVVTLTAVQVDKAEADPLIYF